jgi:hypothetical protein
VSKQLVDLDNNLKEHRHVSMFWMAREDSIDVICTVRSREFINGFFVVFLETDVQGKISTC